MGDTGYPFLVGLAGKAEHGKGTAETVIVEYMPDVCVDTYAKGVRGVLHEMTGIPTAGMQTTAQKAVVIPGYVGDDGGTVAVGRAMQLVGMRMRDAFGPDVWVVPVHARYVRAGRPATVVGDVRFLSEVRMVMREGGWVCRALRPGHVVADGRDPKDRSETALDSLPLMTLINTDVDMYRELLRSIYANPDKAFARTCEVAEVMTSDEAVPCTAHNVREFVRMVELPELERLADAVQTWTEFFTQAREIALRRLSEVH